MVVGRGVSYGDYSPVSHRGRFLGALIMICGVILTSLLTGAVGVLLTLTPFEVQIVAASECDHDPCCTLLTNVVRV